MWYYPVLVPLSEFMGQTCRWVSIATFAQGAVPLAGLACSFLGGGGGGGGLTVWVMPRFQTLKMVLEFSFKNSLLARIYHLNRYNWI